MPSVPPQGKVLVTGASGYLGSWIVFDLLKHGYDVCGTVRADTKGQYLAHLFNNPRFEYIVVPDIGDASALDGFVNDVVAIIHPATPFHYNINDPDDLISAARRGDLAVLKAAGKKEHVKRVIITSSVAAVMELGSGDSPRTFSGLDWNAQSVSEVEQKGKNAWAVHKYFAAKTLAERASWDYWRNHKSEIHWDLVTILPTFICGPFIHEVTSPDGLNTSLADFHNTLIKGTKSTSELEDIEFSWIDVRDAAHAHTLALQKQDAGGERLIVSAGEFVWQDWLDLAHCNGTNPNITRGTPAAGKGHVFSLLYDTSKAAEILGMRYRSMQDSLLDTLSSFQDKGWVE